MQTEHKVKMTRDMEEFSERDERVVFIPADQPEHSDLFEHYTMDWDVWCRMGKPTVVDVSVHVSVPNIGHPVL